MFKPEINPAPHRPSFDPSDNPTLDQSLALDSFLELAKHLPQEILEANFIVYERDPVKAKTLVAGDNANQASDTLKSTIDCFRVCAELDRTKCFLLSFDSATEDTIEQDTEIIEILASRLQLGSDKRIHNVSGPLRDRYEADEKLLRYRLRARRFGIVAGIVINQAKESTVGDSAA